MEAVEFLKERARMCSHYMHKGPCYSNGCPMYQLRCRLSEEGPKKVLCSSVLYKVPEEAVAVVEKWSDEHPVKTRLTDMLEKHPNVWIDSYGNPVMCAKWLGYVKKCPDGCSIASCKECWNTPIEEDNNES